MATHRDVRFNEGGAPSHEEQQPPTAVEKEPVPARLGEDLDVGEDANATDNKEAAPIEDAVAEAQRLVMAATPGDAGGALSEEETDKNAGSTPSSDGEGGPAGGQVRGRQEAIVSRSTARLLRPWPPQRQAYGSLAWRPRVSFPATGDGSGKAAPITAWAFAAKTRGSPDKMRMDQAKLEPDWAEFDKANKQEVDALWENGTWYLTDKKPGMIIIDTEMLNERKRGATGEIERYKGRYVVRGDKQVFPRDYVDKWAPVACHSTLRVLLAMVTARGMHMLQLDIETAFLNGEVDEELYVRQPRGYERGDKGKVFRLLKALYGLKQAARAWYKKLCAMLADAGFTPAAADPCLFLGERAGTTVYVLVYVDDLLIVSASKEAGQTVLEAVVYTFKARVMGEPSYFLSLDIDRNWDDGTLALGQRQYVANLLKRFGLEEANPMRLPLGVGTTLCKDGDPLPVALIELYQERVGALLYLSTCTRPDVSFAVGRLSRYVAAPTVQHLAAAKNVLRYLKGTANQALTYGSAGPLVGYSDADSTADIDTRRSTTGYAFILNGAAVSWVSKRQTSVALSTTEAE